MNRWSLFLILPTGNWSAAQLFPLLFVILYLSQHLEAWNCIYLSAWGQSCFWISLALKLEEEWAFATHTRSNIRIYRYVILRSGHHLKRSRAWQSWWSRSPRGHAWRGLFHLWTSHQLCRTDAQRKMHWWWRGRRRTRANSATASLLAWNEPISILWVIDFNLRSIHRLYCEVGHFWENLRLAEQKVGAYHSS